MKCPICTIDLVMADRLGIEIDYCPKCRGIWLDRGELEKIIERSEPTSPQQPYRQSPDHDDHDDRYESGHGFEKGRHRRKRSMLGDLFDF
jgi:hypothetical protein